MNRRTVLAVALPVAVAGCSGIAGDDGSPETEFLDASGDIEVRIDGEQFDLSADRFQSEHAEEYSLAFHLHEFDDKWYMEGREPVTFAEGIDLLPHFEYERGGGGDVLRIDDGAYDEREGAAIEFAVGGEAVDPTDYELRDGDSLLVSVST